MSGRGPVRLSSSADPPRRVTAVSFIRASLSRSQAVDSAPQRRTQLIEPAEEDGLPRIPREQAEDEPTTRAHDLHGNQHERMEKRFEFHPQDGGLLGGVARAHRPVAGSRNANHALSVHASAAITM